MHQAQIHAESVLFVCPALSFVKSPLHFHHAALQGGHFVFWFRIPPGLNLSEIHARGRGGLQPGASRDSIPPWGRPKADWAARTSSRRSSKADRPARTSSRRSAKADNGGRLCPDGAFPAARPAGTARFLITRGKASFYETATFGRRKVFFCSPFCGLLFCRTRAKLALPAGEKPAAPKPRPPRGGPPNDRDRLPVFAPPARTPAPATRPSPPAREGPLGAPNDRTFPPGAERKARKGKENERRKPECRAHPRYAHARSRTTAPPEDGWEGSQPKRAQRRGKPAKQPRRSAS